MQKLEKSSRGFEQVSNSFKSMIVRYSTHPLCTIYLITMYLVSFTNLGPILAKQYRS